MEGEDTCAIYHCAGKCFVYIYHYKVSPVKIYFRADPDLEPHQFPSNINLKKRKKTTGAWEKRFPYFFELSPSSNLEEVARFLVEAAYPFSFKRTPKKQPELSEQRQRVEDEGYFDAVNIEDARQRKITSIVQRQGQAEFRRKLLEAYDYKCAITRCDAEPALEASHIIPYKGKKTNNIANGLLLRADIHTLFDLHLLSIQPETYEIVLAPELIATSYKELTVQKLYLPKKQRSKPDQDALTRHYECFLKKHLKG